MDWVDSIETIVNSIERGEIPPRELVNKISPTTLAMCLELVRCRRELPMRKLVDKVLNGSIS
jgi:hypothetical protein